MILRLEVGQSDNEAEWRRGRFLRFISVVAFEVSAMETLGTRSCLTARKLDH